MEHEAAAGHLEETWELFVRLVGRGAQPGARTYRALAVAMLAARRFPAEEALDRAIASAEKEGIEIDTEQLHVELCALRDTHAQEEDDVGQLAMQAVSSEVPRSAKERSFDLLDVDPTRGLDVMKRNYSNPRVVVLDDNNMLGVDAKQFSDRVVPGSFEHDESEFSADTELYRRTRARPFWQGRG